MPDITQRTLTGGEQLLTDIDALRERPATLLWCETCETFVLRSRRFQHAHALVPPSVLEDDEEDEGDDAVRVGAMYEITLEYTVTYRFRVPAWGKHAAKERAKDLELDARPTDEYLLHTETRELRDIMSDDPNLPDDHDPYGATRLWEVYGEEDDSDA